MESEIGGCSSRGMGWKRELQMTLVGFGPGVGWGAGVCVCEICVHRQLPCPAQGKCRVDAARVHHQNENIISQNCFQNSGRGFRPYFTTVRNRFRVVEMFPHCVHRRKSVMLWWRHLGDTTSARQIIEVLRWSFLGAYILPICVSSPDENASMIGLDPPLGPRFDLITSLKALL